MNGEIRRPADRLLVLIATWRTWYDVPPSQRELASILGTSQGNINARLIRLQRAGLIEWDPGIPRSLRLTRVGDERLSDVLPVVRPLPVPGPQGPG